MKRTPTAVRSLVRTEYLEGAGTCRELAEKHRLPVTTVENWCRRERWRSQLTAIDGRLTAETEQSLVKRADDLVARRAAFLERSLTTGEALLDQIERERKLLKPGEIETLRKLVSCWREATVMQRKSLGMEESAKEAKCNFNLALLQQEPELIEIKEAAAGVLAAD